MNRKPIRVLQVVGGMSRGGVETWMLHVVRNLDRSRARIDFLVHTAETCAYDEELKRLGCGLIPCPHPDRPLRYGRNFRRVLREHGPYDVVHSHVHHYSGLIARLARKEGVPVRIAHSHTDTRRTDRQARWPRRLYLGLMRHWIERHATHRLAASREAGVALFGPESSRTPWQVLYCGVDLAPFETRTARGVVLAELGLAADALVLGHVGNFVEQKNHGLLVRIAAEVFAREPRAHLLLVGGGPGRAAIEKQVHEAGLSERVTFLGSRPDVPRLLEAMDVFVFPSLHEGLPLVGVEAQGAGLPLVMSETITPEVVIVPELVRRLSLEQPVETWAEQVLAAAAGPRPPREQSLEMVRNSPCDIRQGVRQLERFYVESLVRA
jgi:glycosyltransferase involved in cell wall biosynthesis